MEHNRLSEYRKRAGLTQRELADKLNVTQQTIWYYEHGKREMKSSVLIALSKALDCSIAELLGIDDFKGVIHNRDVPKSENEQLNSYNESTNHYSDRGQAELNECWELCSAADRQTLLKVARSFRANQGASANNQSKSEGVA